MLILAILYHNILFHYRKEDTGEKKNLMYTIVDMETPDGLGKVVSKNQLITTGFMADMLTATRHGNGRDWWIAAPETDSEDGYLLLLTPQGVEGPFPRYFGKYWDYGGANGQAVFSPDGTKYARMHRANGLHLARFNRCTGQFSNAVKINFPSDTISGAGAAFSPNSRYLYVSATDKLYQFDTWATNIAATKQTVAVYDGFQSPFSTRFFQLMLAPDGKIYITTPNDNNVLHIIHNPDWHGQSCNVEQHGMLLPTMHFSSTPNFPHFRLYDLPGSACDTLGIDGPSVGAPELAGEVVLRAQPNPASGSVVFTHRYAISGFWSLYAASGALVQSGRWPAVSASLSLELGALAPGMYYFYVATDSGNTLFCKLSIVR
jgi:hypothetical protein